jgi:predicted ATPase
MLDGQLKLAWRGRRTAAPRQQTLRATLDWSYGLITEEDRALLRRLAVFPGEFPLDAAQTVAAAGESSEADVLSRLPELVAKSLITAEVSGPRPNYRLLHTTRTYALAKLQEAGEGAAISRRHADYILDRFRAAEQEANDRPVSEWLADYRPRLDDLRTALDWAMGPDGDVELGVSLTAAGVPLFTSLSLLNELQARAELALARTRGEAEGGEREMKLFAAMANVLVNTRGPSAAAAEACTRALTIAERIGDLDYQMRALLALWNDCFSNGQIHRALELAQKFSRAAHASESRGDILVSHRVLGVTQYVAGEAEQARVNLQATVDGYATAITDSHMARFVFEQQASSRGLLGSVLMYLGKPGSAMKAIRQSVEEAIASEHALTICGVLGTTSVPVALHVGDLETAAGWGARLLDTAQQHGYASWIALGRSLEGLLRLRRGDLIEGVEIITAALVGVDRSNSRYPLVFCEYAEALAETGDSPAAHALLDDALARAQARQEIWYVPEYLRYKARLIRRSRPDEAEAQFVSALRQAEAVGARTWALRIALDLAELQRDADRMTGAQEALARIVRSFTDGHETGDLRRARHLLGAFA